MKRAIFHLALAASLVLTCTPSGVDDPDPGPVIWALAAAGVFNNFCGVPVEYPVGVNSVTIAAGVYHWITFPNDSNSNYNITINESPGQNVLLGNIGCKTGSSLDSLQNTSATGQSETFLASLSSRGIILLCSEGCNAPVNFTIPSPPAPPQ